MTLALGLGKLALLAGTAAPAVPQRIATDLQGNFDTQRQYDAADQALKVAPTPTGTWLDRQYATMRLIDAPLVGRTVFYLEWRTGGPTGPISRQRIWALDANVDGVRMRFFTIRDPASLAGARDGSASVGAVKPADLVGYPADCDVRFTDRKSWTGRIDPKDCRIVAQSGRGMRLDVTIARTPTGFSYQEKGILDDGRVTFAVPPMQPYRFDRVAR